MPSNDERATTRHYLLTYGGLVLLATLSLLLAVLPVHAGLGSALAIASVKALLVLASFMHLREETVGYKLVVLVAALLVATLVALTALDPLTRPPYPPAPAQNAQFAAPVP